MEQALTRRRDSFSTREKRILAIALAVVGILSPLYVDRTKDHELDEGVPYFSSYLPVLLLLLITATIAVSSFLEHGFDPYWIHRVIGSSTGLVVILLVLSLVLKCKASYNKIN